MSLGLELSTDINHVKFTHASRLQVLSLALIGSVVKREPLLGVRRSVTRHLFLLDVAITSLGIQIMYVLNLAVVQLSALSRSRAASVQIGMTHWLALVFPDRIRMLAIRHQLSISITCLKVGITLA